MRQASKTAGEQPDALGMDQQRYGLIALTLHWIIAALILTQIGLGWYMNEVLPDHSAAQARIETLHISIGLTALLLILVRVGVRAVFPAPPLPSALADWEKALARITHVLFYVLMLALPLTGWALVSVRPGQISFWGLPWPHLPALDVLERACTSTGSSCAAANSHELSDLDRSPQSCAAPCRRSEASIRRPSRPLAHVAEKNLIYSQADRRTALRRT